MDDLISRKDLMDLYYRYRPYMAVKLPEFEYFLKALPSAERKRGKWIKENIVLTSLPPQYKWHCSECGKSLIGHSAEVLTDFCPNCGADMRGGKDERTD